MPHTILILASWRQQKKTLVIYIPFMIFDLDLKETVVTGFASSRDFKYWCSPTQSYCGNTPVIFHTTGNSLVLFHPLDNSLVIFHSHGNSLVIFHPLNYSLGIFHPRENSLVIFHPSHWRYRTHLDNSWVIFHPLDNTLVIFHPRDNSLVIFHPFNNSLHGDITPILTTHLWYFTHSTTHWWFSPTQQLTGNISPTAAH